MRPDCKDKVARLQNTMQNKTTGTQSQLRRTPALLLWQAAVCYEAKWQTCPFFRARKTWKARKLQTVSKPENSGLLTRFTLATRKFGLLHSRPVASTKYSWGPIGTKSCRTTTLVMQACCPATRPYCKVTPKIAPLFPNRAKTLLGPFPAG